MSVMSRCTANERRLSSCERHPARKKILVLPSWYWLDERPMVWMMVSHSCRTSDQGYQADEGSAK